MLKIECPFCGPRSEAEFRCGGQNQIDRPGIEASAEIWQNYLYIRRNPKGSHVERWVHQYGCGLWFNAVRNTVTHDISATFKMGETAPSDDKVDGI